MGDKLVISGWNDGKDVIFCFNAVTGELLWKREYIINQHERQGGSRYGMGSRASANIDGNMVYPFGGWGDLVCWDLESGKEYWRENMMQHGGLPANFGFASSPLVYKNTVIVLGGGDIMVVAFERKQAGSSGNVPGLSAVQTTGKEDPVMLHRWWQIWLGGNCNASI